jgi:acyl-CoA thioester hydrolase
MSTIIAALEEFAVLYKHQLAWGEMDAFQHVNNTVYFKYFESARIDYMTQTGYLEQMQTNQCGPILADVYCKFKRPLTFPDNIVIGTKISNLHASEFIMNHSIYSLAQKTIVATGHGKIVHYDYKAKKRADFPSELLEEIFQLQPELSKTPI